MTSVKCHLKGSNMSVGIFFATGKIEVTFKCHLGSRDKFWINSSFQDRLIAIQRILKL